MNLTIDIGNTLIKMAVFDGGEIVEKLLAEECDTKLLDGLLARWPAIDGPLSPLPEAVPHRWRGCCGCVP